MGTENRGKGTIPGQIENHDDSSYYLSCKPDPADSLTHHATHRYADPYHVGNCTPLFLAVTHTHNFLRSSFLGHLSKLLPIPRSRHLYLPIQLLPPIMHASGNTISGEPLQGLTTIPPHEIYDPSTYRSPNYSSSLPTFFPDAQTSGCLLQPFTKPAPTLIPKHLTDRSPALHPEVVPQMTTSSATFQGAYKTKRTR